MNKEISNNDLNFFKIQSKLFPSINEATTEIINLSAILKLPKGTEHFLSDIHGEDEAFSHVIKNASGAVKNKIEQAAQAILDARVLEENRCAAQGQKCSLAIMYAANNMPAELVKAHNDLDKAVDAAYNYKGKKDDAARVAFLFERYQELISSI